MAVSAALSRYLSLSQMAGSPWAGMQLKNYRETFACQLLNRVHTSMHPSTQPHTPGQVNSPYQAQPSFIVAPVIPPPLSMKSECNKDTDGIGAGIVGFLITVGFLTLARFLHTCAWCAFRFKKLHPHHEQDRLKKQAFRDKKAAETVASMSAISDHLLVVCPAVVDQPLLLLPSTSVHTPLCCQSPEPWCQVSPPDDPSQEELRFS